jgi:hypothetical protein
MKKHIVLTLLMAIIGNIGALDTGSYQFIDRLLGLKGPGEPHVFEDGIIFTAPSSHRRVGIAFAHEGFSRVYWFQTLMVREEPAKIPAGGKPPPESYRDSGIRFYAFTIPEDLREVEYRLVIEGLWTFDPLNPRRRLDPASGQIRSFVPCGEVKRPPVPVDMSPGLLTFTYAAESGERITVGGSFNGWDPFMYELRESSPGSYSLTLPLPPGVYQYVFFHRGERFPDPRNSRRVYTREGHIASEALVR